MKKKMILQRNRQNKMRRSSGCVEGYFVRLQRKRAAFAEIIGGLAT